VVPGAGHFTLEDGYGPLPAVLAWCDAATSARDVWAAGPGGGRAG
jgi:hypothetical protein